MGDQLNRVKFNTETTGTGSSIDVGSAYSASFFTPAEAGAINGRRYSYIIQQGNDFEIQESQVYSSTGPVIARGAPSFSKIGGAAGTSKIDLDGTAVVSFGPSALDLLFQETRGADVASASTINLDTTTGGLVDVTGTTTITAVTLTDGRERTVRFTGTLTLTNGSNLILPGFANITTAAGDFAVFRGYAAGVVRCVCFTKSSGLPIATLTDTDTVKWDAGTAGQIKARVALPNYLTGLTLSNNASDATNDIDIAAGCAADATNVVLMSLTSALTKRLDATWAVGSGNGGLDTGSIANTTYHVFLIQRSDTGVVDVLFSTSAASPTMPANYDRKRRIGSVIRAAGAIRPFVQNGDVFRWRGAAVNDVTSTNPGTAAVTRTLTVPTGIVVEADIVVLVAALSSASVLGLITSLTETDRPAGPADFTVGVAGPAAGNQNGVPVRGVFTNASGQIRTRLNNSGSLDTIVVLTYGWIDFRGKDGQ